MTLHELIDRAVWRWEGMAVRGAIACVCFAGLGAWMAKALVQR